METIDQGIADFDIWAVYRSAHALRALLSTFETGEPVSELDAVIEAARQGDDYVAAAFFRSLRGDLVRVVNAIKQLAEL